MAQFFYLDGTDLGNARVRLGSEQGFISVAERGTIATGAIVLDDPNADLTVTGWRPFRVTEPDCSTPTIWRGYIADRTVHRGQSERGSLRLSAGRVWDCDLVDINALFYFRTIYLKDGKRPQETDIARRDWIMGTRWLSGLIEDLGLVSDDEPATLDEADYRGQTPADVLNDCVTARFGKNYFAYWDDTTQKVGLFYGPTSATTFTSTLRLSNVLADVDNTTTFAPIDQEATLARSPSGTYSGVYLQYANGAIYREDTDVAAAFIRRDFTYMNSRIGRLSTAESIAEQLLARSATEEDRITVTVRLPKAKVNLIREGMRLECKFSHLPGYTSFSFLRVLRRTVKQVFESEAWYDLDLELVGGHLFPTGGGGGGIGGPPAPPTGPFNPPSGDQSCSPTIIQQRRHGYNGDTSDFLPVNPTVGNLLVWAAAHRDSGAFVPPTGWTSLVTNGRITTPSTPIVGLMTRTVVTGDTATFDAVRGLPWGQVGHGIVYELEGVEATATATGGPSWPGTNSTFAIQSGSVTAPDGALVIGVVRIEVADALPDCAVTPDAGVTEDLDNNKGTAAPSPHAWVGHKSGASGATNLGGSALVGHTFPDNSTNQWTGAAAAFSCTGSASTGDQDAPAHGQQVTEQLTGDCITTVFRLNNPYLAGSLFVYSDDGHGVLTRIAAEETDPAEGVFTLGFAPCDNVTREVILTGQDPGDSRYYVLTDDNGRVLVGDEVISSDGGRIIVTYQAGAGPTTGEENPQPTPAPPPSIPPVTPPASVTDYYPNSPSTTSDHAAAITSWITSTAGPGKVLGFQAGTYRVDERVLIEDVNNITLVLDGTTLRRVTTTSSSRPMLRFDGCDTLAIYNGIVEGPATDSDIRSIPDAFPRQDEHGFELRDCHGVTISGTVIRKLWGDGIYYNRRNAGAASTLCEDMTFDRLTISTVGRNCISHITGQRITVQDSVLTAACLHGFDVEPNLSDDVTNELTLTGLTISDYNASLTASDPGYAVQIGAGYNATQATHVLMDSLTVSPPAAAGYPQINVSGPSSGSRHSDVKLLNSTCDHSGSSTVQHVNGWVNTGNSGFTSLPASGDIS